MLEAQLLPGRLCSLLCLADKEGQLARHAIQHLWGGRIATKHSEPLVPWFRLAPVPPTPLHAALMAGCRDHTRASSQHALMSEGVISMAPVFILGLGSCRRRTSPLMATTYSLRGRGGGGKHQSAKANGTGCVAILQPPPPCRAAGCTHVLAAPWAMGQWAVQEGGSAPLPQRNAAKLHASKICICQASAICP